jgi:hypothetical protein
LVKLASPTPALGLLAAMHQSKYNKVQSAGWEELHISEI